MAAIGSMNSSAIWTPGSQQCNGWREVRRLNRDSHLALGIAAEQYGLLSVAEREYQALIKVFPDAEAPARLLANVQALRDDSVLSTPEVF